MTNDSPTLHKLQHHARKLMPVASLLSLGIRTDLEPRGWTVEHRWTDCFSIKKGNKEFHFRYARNPWRLIVKDGLRGKIVDELKSEVDVLKFVRKVRGL